MAVEAGAMDRRPISQRIDKFLCKPHWYGVFFVNSSYFGGGWGKKTRETEFLKRNSKIFTLCK
jgi:hypothetical protein